MADSPVPRPQIRGHFSLPQLARAAAYHAHAYRVRATFEVIPTELPAGSSHAVAAGAWWALDHSWRGATDPAFVSWAAQRASTLGADRSSVETLLSEPLQAEVEAPSAGTALPLGAPLLQISGAPAPILLRAPSIQTTLSLGFGSATRAAALCRAARGCSIIDDASVHHHDHATSAFLAWCGRVGGFSGTTHTMAGWHWELPVVGIPSPDLPLSRLGDAIIPSDDLHAAVAQLVRRATASAVALKRVSLDRPVVDDSDLERHHHLRRALDRHGQRRVRICARVASTPEAIAHVVDGRSSIDILVLSDPWWGPAPTAWVAVDVPQGIDVPAPHPLSQITAGRKQLQRVNDKVVVAPWGSPGLLNPLYRPGLPLPVVPVLLSRRDPLREAVHPHLVPAPAIDRPLEE